MFIALPGLTLALDEIDQFEDVMKRRKRRFVILLMKNLLDTKFMKWSILTFCFGLSGLCSNMPKRLPANNAARNMESF